MVYTVQDRRQWIDAQFESRGVRAGIQQCDLKVGNRQKSRKSRRSNAHQGRAKQNPLNFGRLTAACCMLSSLGYVAVFLEIFEG